MHYTSSTTHPTAFHNPTVHTTNKHKAYLCRWQQNGTRCRDGVVSFPSSLVGFWGFHVLVFIHKTLCDFLLISWCTYTRNKAFITTLTPHDNSRKISMFMWHHIFHMPRCNVIGTHIEHGVVFWASDACEYMQVKASLVIFDRWTHVWHTFVSIAI